MGDVILFRQRKHPAPPRSNNERTGQILFFTGVRYQRMEAPDLRPTSEGGKRKRKRG
jgi:hypothetical protein